MHYIPDMVGGMPRFTVTITICTGSAPENTDVYTTDVHADCQANAIATALFGAAFFNPDQGSSGQFPLEAKFVVTCEVGKMAN